MPYLIRFTASLSRQPAHLYTNPTLFRSRRINSPSLSPKFKNEFRPVGCGYRLTRPTPVAEPVANLAWACGKVSSHKSFNNTFEFPDPIISDDTISIESEHCPSYKPNSVLKTPRRNSTAAGAGCTKLIKTKSQWRKYGGQFSRQAWICDVIRTADTPAWRCRNQTLQSAPQKPSSTKTQISS